MIDPQGQANKWVRLMEKENKLRVIKFSEGDDYIKVLDNSIQIGVPVLLEDTQTKIDPALEPILGKKTFKNVNYLFYSIMSRKDFFKLDLATETLLMIQISLYISLRKLRILIFYLIFAFFLQLLISLSLLMGLKNNYWVTLLFLKDQKLKKRERN
jgi:hypothetical protein